MGPVGSAPEAACRWNPGADDEAYGTLLPVISNSVKIRYNGSFMLFFAIVIPKQPILKPKEINYYHKEINAKHKEIIAMKVMPTTEEGADFPFRLVFQDTKPPQQELPDHLHDWHELIYVYAGKGTMLVNHAFYEMNPGDVFLIPGNTLHRAFPDEGTPVTSSALFFSPSLIPRADLGEPYSLLRILEHARRTKRYKMETSEAEQTLNHWIYWRYK